MLPCQAPGANSLYRHVFSETGCAEALYHAELSFSNEDDGVWANPPIAGAGGCAHVRLLVARDHADVHLVDVALEMEGCPIGMLKYGDVCFPYEPGYWCAAGDKCQPPPHFDVNDKGDPMGDRCGGVEYFCRGAAGGAIRERVREGYHSVPAGADADPALRSGEALCPAGSYCDGGVAYECAVGSFSAPGQTECTKAAPGFHATAARTRQVPCSPGEYSDVAGLSECKACEAGKYRADTTMTAVTCSLCPACWRRCTLWYMRITTCTSCHAYRDMRYRSAAL